MKLPGIAVLGLLAAVAGPVKAAELPQNTHTAHMVPFDTDKNGVTTHEERQAGRKARFAEMDKNQDGKLSREEFAKGHLKWRGEMDANQDGLVELGEYVVFFCGEEPKKDDAAKHKSAGKHYTECVARRTAFYAEIDTDKNGKVTGSEHNASYDDSLKKMDRNADGIVELDEFYVFEVAADAKKPGRKKIKATRGSAPAKTEKTDTAAPATK
ncbi:MAG: hypothetical protein PHW69_03975 [Elusimicrobiaceae bacterium]|nr:hypothetical protein [Elusimicrobiaceae bacterium]